METATVQPSPSPAEDKWLQLPSEQITTWLDDARRRTHELVDDLTDEQWDGKPTAIANPINWEVGHVAHFYERFLLRQLGHDEPLIRGGMAMYNSFALNRDDRWEAPLPSRRGTLEYLQHVTWYVRDYLQRNDPDPWVTYLYLTSILHEEMHIEALTWYRQIQACPAPVPDGTVRAGATPDRAHGDLPGDVAVPGGGFYLGATRDQPYVWDNEKWAHRVEIAPFHIARAPVTQAQFAEFVNERGYDRQEFWDFEGWRWRQREGADRPLYWKQDGGNWLRRHYEEWVPLEPHHPMVYVNWYEAQAWCRWAGRRLPHEAEWEQAASGSPAADDPDARKRTYPWGDDAPDGNRAHLDANAVGCVDVAAYPQGESAFGCRQMLGNVWEWTATAFYPYPGYLVDSPYREYSAPWFGNHMVLRGGSWATRSRLVRNTYRNFFQPDRRDIIAGFRTCPL